MSLKLSKLSIEDDRKSDATNKWWVSIQYTDPYFWGLDSLSINTFRNSDHLNKSLWYARVWQPNLYRPQTKFGAR